MYDPVLAMYEHKMLWKRISSISEILSHTKEVAKMAVNGKNYCTACKDEESDQIL